MYINEWAADPYYIEVYLEAYNSKYNSDSLCAETLLANINENNFTEYKKDGALLPR